MLIIVPYRGEPVVPVYQDMLFPRIKIRVAWSEQQVSKRGDISIIVNGYIIIPALIFFNKVIRFFTLPPVIAIPYNLISKGGKSFCQGDHLMIIMIVSVGIDRRNKKFNL